MTLTQVFLDSSHTSKQQTEKPTLTLIGPELSIQHHIWKLHQQNAGRLSDEEPQSRRVSSILCSQSFYFHSSFLLSLGAAVSCWPFSVLHICLILDANRLSTKAADTVTLLCLSPKTTGSRWNHVRHWKKYWHAQRLKWLLYTHNFSAID